MPQYRIRLSNGKTITVAAGSPQEAAKIVKRKGALREGVEGFAAPFAGLADFAGRYASPVSSLAATTYDMVQGLRGKPGIQPVVSNLVDKLSVAGPGNQTPAYATGRGLGGTAIGAGTLALTGGLSAPLLGSTALGAMGGSHVEAGLSRSGAGSGTSMVGGLGTDLLVSALSRNPAGLANILKTRMSPAANLARAMNLGDETAEAAVTVSEATRTALHSSASAAFSRVPVHGGASTRITASRASDVAQHLVEVNGDKLTPTIVKKIAAWGSRFKEGSKTITEPFLDQLGRQVSRTEAIPAAGVRFRDLRIAIAEINDLVKKAALKPEFDTEAGIAVKLYDSLVDDMDEIAKLSPQDAAAVAKLREATAAWRKYKDAFPSRSKIETNLFSKRRAIDDPAEAVQTLLVGKRRQTEAKLLFNSLAGDEPARRGVARALSEHVLMSKGVERNPQAALRELRAIKDVAEVFLTKHGYRRFEHHLAKAAPRKFGVTTLGGGTIGGILGGMMFSGPGSAGGFVVGSGLDMARRYLSADRFHKIALDAVYDPKVQELLTRRVTDETAFIKELTDVVARNGIYEMAEQGRGAQP